jgi:acetyl-CoA acyltransferase
VIFGNANGAGEDNRNLGRMAGLLNDGASALLMGSELAATRIGGDPVARIAGRGAAALEPPMFGYAPVAAVEIALQRAGITWRG